MLQKQRFKVRQRIFLTEESPYTHLIIYITAVELMGFGLSAKAVADVNDVKSSLIRTRRIVFTPSTELKDELSKTSIQITCYDRNGEIVKRVTSTDDGTVEEPDNSDSTGENEGTNTGGTTPGGNTGGNPGGGTGGGGDDDDTGEND